METDNMHNELLMLLKRLSEEAKNGKLDKRSAETCLQYARQSVTTWKFMNQMVSDVIDSIEYDLKKPEELKN
jgi:hypothetical protein